MEMEPGLLVLMAGQDSRLPPLPLLPTLPPTCPPAPLPTSKRLPEVRAVDVAVGWLSIGSISRIEGRVAGCWYTRERLARRVGSDGWVDTGRGGAGCGGEGSGCGGGASGSEPSCSTREGRSACWDSCWGWVKEPKEGLEDVGEFDGEPASSSSSSQLLMRRAALWPDSAASQLLVWRAALRPGSAAAATATTAAWTGGVR